MLKHNINIPQQSAISLKSSDIHMLKMQNDLIAVEQWSNVYNDDHPSKYRIENFWIIKPAPLQSQLSPR